MPAQKKTKASGAAGSAAGSRPPARTARRPKLVREVMSADLLMIEAHDHVSTAAAVMEAGRVGSALVMDHDTLVGIFTERDVLHALRRSPTAALASPVTKWMTKDPMTIPPSETIRGALRRMLKGGFRHLPVTDGGHVVGVVSLRDLARALAG